MYSQSAVHGTTYIGATRSVAHEYYHLGRVRTQSADAVLGFFASAVSSLMVTKRVSRDELFDRYDVKLWSYNDSLVRFTLATAPTVGALAAIFAAYRVVESVRSALSL